jgi:hypothetical protein
MSREALMEAIREGDRVSVESEAIKEDRATTGSEVIRELFLNKNVFVRAVTFHYTGRLTDAVDGMVVLEDAAWIGESGRWARALASGELSEVEPYPAGRVVVGGIVDISEWKHELPRDVK